MMNLENVYNENFNNRWCNFIGTRLSNELADENNDVTVMVVLVGITSSKVKKVKQNLMDLTTEDLREYDAVVFMAGLSNDPMANFSLENFIENAAALLLGIHLQTSRGQKFVYTKLISYVVFLTARS